MSETTKKGIPPILVEFYTELLRIHQQTEEPLFFSPAGEFAERWRAGTPLLVCCPPQIEAARFFQIMGQVKDLLQKFHPERQAEFGLVYHAFLSDPDEHNLLAANILRWKQNVMQRFSAEKDIPAFELGLLVNHTMMPFQRGYARQMVKLVDLNHWQWGYCPICGNHAGLARLAGEAGRRYLYCVMCDLQWPFKRIACPHCLNVDQKTLQFFTIEGEERYRVYACGQCRGYLKTIDDRKAECETDELFWEDLRTVHLDMLAMREGYQFLSSPADR